MGGVEKRRVVNSRRQTHIIKDPLKISMNIIYSPSLCIVHCALSIAYLIISEPGGYQNFFYGFNIIVGSKVSNNHLNKLFR